MEVTRYSGQRQEDLSPLFAGYTYGRYCSDWSLDAQSSRRLKRDRLFVYLQQNEASCWVATEKGRILGVLGLQESAWDTAFWGIKCAAIDHLYACGSREVSKDSVVKALVGAADRWCRGEQIAFVLARADIFDLAAIHTLEDYGFRYIETAVTNTYDLRRIEARPSTGYHMRAAQPDEADALASMVRGAFLTHRFYADKRFPVKKADAMYQEWVRSSLESSVWTTIVLEAGSKVRGFLIYCLEDLTAYFGLRFVKWRLAALAQADRGKGYGIQLFQGAMQFTRDQAEIVDSGLTIRNTQSFNLHNRLGFKLLCSSAVFHKWYS